MNELSLFANDNFGSIRVLSIEDSPWFVGKDVATALGYANTKDALKNHVDDEDKKHGVAIRDLMGRTQYPVLINESGLYSLILSSKLPSARQFKRWVTHEVIPAIRRHGAYVAPSLASQIISDPDTLYLLVEQLRAEHTARIAAERSEQESLRKLCEANDKIAHLAPQPVFLFQDSPDAEHCCSVGELADSLSSHGRHFTRGAMFSWLRQHGYIRDDCPLPTHDAIASGYFLVMEKRSGRSRYYTAAVTLAGQLHFAAVFDF